MIEPQTAATVMIAREGAAGIEILMLRRSRHSAFMPDVFVFPGGRVEPQDAAAALSGGLAGAAHDPACAYAAARETFEECGLLFATTKIDEFARAAAREQILAGTLTFSQMLIDLRTCVDAAALRYFSRWITPPGEPRRYDTHFFVARAPAGQVARADAFETHDGVWIAPREALERHAAGTFALIFPTVKHLERLSAFTTIDALLDYASNKPIRTVTPQIDATRSFAIPPLLEGVW
jgi:recombination protein RecT